MQIKLEDLKRLREETSAGVADCRQALEDADGDMAKAREWLKQKGIERAAKKEGREVKAGSVFSYVHHTGRLASLVAVACETDFVAKTDHFKNLGRELALQVASTKAESVEVLLEQEYIRDASKKISDLVKETIGTLGENIQVLDLKVISL